MASLHMALEMSWVQHIKTYTMLSLWQSMEKSSESKTGDDQSAKVKESEDKSTEYTSR